MIGPRKSIDKLEGGTIAGGQPPTLSGWSQPVDVPPVQRTPI